MSVGRPRILCVVAALALPSCLLPSEMPEPVDPPGAERISWRGPDGHVSALRAGDPQGRRVLYVHGTPGDATNWSRFLEAPLPGTDSVALDRPGFGDSDPRRAVPCLACQADALEPALRIDEGAGTVLVGHSLGGPIVLRAACDRPELVGGVVVVAGNVDPSIEGPQWYNYFALGFLAFLPRALVNANAELMPQRAELQELVPLLADLTVPVAIVHGTDDELVPYANALYLEELLAPRGPVRLFPIEDAGHLVIWTRPEVVREAIEWVLAESQSADG